MRHGQFYLASLQLAAAALPGARAQPASLHDFAVRIAAVRLPRTGPETRRRS